MLRPPIFADKLDWNLLRTFMVIVEEGGITRASERLHLTQPAVSLALKRLEEAMGCKLVSRGSGGFAVTSAGDAVYGKATQIYGSLSRLNVALSDAPEGLTGNLRLLLISRVPSPMFDEILEAFHARYPMVTYDLEVSTSAEIHQALLHKAAGLGICLMAAPVPGLLRETFTRQSYAFYCGRTHRLFGQINLPLDVLRDEDIVSFTSDQLDGSLSPITQFRRANAIRGKIVGVSASLDEVQRMVRSGLGIGCLPDHSVKDDLEAGLLFRLPPYEGVVQLESYLCWSESTPLTHAEQAFLTFAREYLAAQLK